MSRFCPRAYVLALVMLSGLGVACATAPRAVVTPARPAAPAPDPAAIACAEAAAAASAATLRAAEDAAHAATRIARTAIIRRARAATRGAFIETEGWMGATSDPLPPQPPYTKVLRAQADVKRTSASMGSVGGGELYGGRALAESGPYHVIIDRAIPRKTRWGTPQLVRLIQDAGRQVARAYPGSKLVVGNLSVEGGGDIRWSRSHNSGRDADLAFYVLDTRKKGAARRVTAAPDLLSFTDAGVARGSSHYRFDVARNWALAKALITSRHAQLQYLFISTALKDKLLAHARATREPLWLIRRAERLLHQPTDSSPHDDHFHIRLTCTLDDRLRGCLDRGPKWPWMDRYEDDLEARARAMRAAMRDPSADVRLAALEYLFTIDSPHEADIALAYGARDADAKVRAYAIHRATRSWHINGTTLALTTQLLDDPTTDAPTRRRLYALLQRSRDPFAAAYARGRLLDAKTPLDERVLAATTLHHHMHEALVPFLLAQLATQPPQVQAELATTLRRITARAEAIDWLKAPATERARALRAWTAWWTAHRDQSRHDWLLAALKQDGISPQLATTPRAIDPLLKKLPDAPPHLAYVYNQHIATIAQRWTPFWLDDGAAVAKHWARWWKRNRARLLAGS